MAFSWRKWYRKNKNRPEFRRRRAGYTAAWLERQSEEKRNAIRQKTRAYKRKHRTQHIKACRRYYRKFVQRICHFCGVPGNSGSGRLKPIIRPVLDKFDFVEKEVLACRECSGE